MAESFHEKFFGFHAQLLGAKNGATAKTERQHADDDYEDIERGTQRSFDAEICLELNVAIAEKPCRFRFQRQHHLSVVVAVVEEYFDVESITIGRGNRSRRLQIHRFDGELYGRLHQRRKLDVNILGVQVRLDAAARVVRLHGETRRVDFRVEDVAFVEAEHDAFLVLIETKLHGSDRVVIGRVRIRSDRATQVPKPINCVINCVEILFHRVHRQRTRLGRISAHLKLHNIK